MGNRDSTLKGDEEEICIKIFEMVDKLYPKNSKKITGMLLESDHEELNLLLTSNPEELQTRIKLAAQTVQEHTKVNNDSLQEICRTEDKEQIGNRIYDIAKQLYSPFAANITGMLLEMDAERLVLLLQDENELLNCIHQAAQVYMENQTEQEQLLLSTKLKHQNSTQPILTDQNDYNTSSLCKQQEKEALGEQIYFKIEAVYPNEAAKVTGMLLEMDTQILKQILDDSSLFDQKLNEALEVLHTVDKWKNGIVNSYLDGSEQKEDKKSVSVTADDITHLHCQTSNHE